jgi:dTDP-4-dehydrorhamnose 3,5-epimerase
MPELRPTDIPDVLVVATRWFEDGRGTFSEVYSDHAWAAAGLGTRFVQDNHVVSRRAGTLRALHFQRPPAAQAKLIRVVRGAIRDVAVDIRTGSPWFGRWVAVELSAANRLQLFVPRGFAHGYVTLEPDTEVVYKVDAPYSPAHEAGIAWNDPALGITWPLPAGGPVLAERDRTLPTLSALGPVFNPPREPSP